MLSRKLSKILSFGLLAISSSRLLVVACREVPRVDVINGTYAGEYYAKLDQDIFRGIPYAQPPVGNLRFEIPNSLNTSWQGVKNATKFSPSCVGDQTNAWGGDMVVSEDCLTLNVVRPSGYRAGDNLPVVIWIHGGGFRAGGSSLAIYNQSWIIHESVKQETPIIAVSINYRLAAFGWLWSEEMEARGASNLGLRDQRLAMRWVHENIAAFGGDPKKVTVQGQSAGAVSIGYHLVTHDGRDDGLFRAAIGQSGTPASYKYYEDAASDKLSCLKTVPVSALSDAFVKYAPNENPYTPFIDGDMITQSSTTSLKEGKFLRNINTTEEFKKSLSEMTTGGTNISDTTADIIAALYPDIPAIGIPATFHGRPSADSGFGRMWKRVAAYTGDQQLHSSRRLTAQTWAKSGVPFYSYHFNVVPNGAGPLVAVTHAVETPFVFYDITGAGAFAREQPNPFEDKPVTYKQLSSLMSKMWINFINDVNPISADNPSVQWPSYTLDAPQNLVFDANFTDLAYLEDDHYRAEAINFIIENYEAYWGR
ncbi:Fc.00g057940.m01.CDS01 [Cosmosporella sp. VM-42]